LFLAEILPGTSLYNGANLLGTVSSIVSNTQLTLTANALSTNAGISFASAGNVIGSLSNANSIFNQANTVTGILVSSSSTANIMSNNMVAGVNTGTGLVGFQITQPAGGTAAIVNNNKIEFSTAGNQFRGILTGATGNYEIGTSVAGNTIGHLTNPARRITLTANSGQSSGIYSNSVGTVNVGSVATPNVVAGIVSNNPAATGELRGISLGQVAAAAINNITGNIVRRLTATNSMTLYGILNEATSTVGSEVISRNRIDSLYSLGTVATTTMPIWFASGATGTHSIERNIVHSIFVSTQAATSIINGIFVSSGTSTVSNNMISIGRDVTANCLVTGINNNSSAVVNYLFNSVYLSGSGSIGAPTYGSAGLVIANNTAANVIRNNIFYNNRSGNSGGHYGIYQLVNAANTSTLTNNDIYVPQNFNQTNGGYLGWWTGLNRISIAAFPFVSGASPTASANISAQVDFVSADDLHILANSGCTSVDGAGVAVAVTVDIDGINRCPLGGCPGGGAAPDIGADEFAPVAPVALSGNYTIGSSTVAIPPFGAGTNFPTIKDAVNALICRNVGGPVTFHLSDAAYNAGTGEIFPITIPTIIGASTTNLITFKPYLAGTPVISGSSGTSLFIFDLIGSATAGANWIIFDGDNNTGGTNKNMTITNTFNGNGGSVFVFRREASNNIVRNCVIRGGNTSVTVPTAINPYPTQGLIAFLNGTLTTGTGNDANTITNNDIGDNGTSNIYTAIYSNDANNRGNNNNIISNNNIYNFTNFGINVPTQAIITPTGPGTTDAWQITGNSFYYNWPTLSAVAQTAINFIPVLSIANNNSNGNDISGNFIGGQATQCGTIGDYWVNTGAVLFTGINLSVGITTATTINGNTIQNLNLTSTAGSTFRGIYSAIGAVNVGGTTGNTIGDATADNAIKIGGSGDMYGIWVISDRNSTISNNTVANISSTSATNTFRGITGNLSGTAPGSTTASLQNNSVYSISLSTASTNYVAFNGIEINNITNGALINFGNTTGNIVGSTSNASSIENSSIGLNRGIFINTNASGNNISNNTVAGFVAGSNINNISHFEGFNLSNILAAATTEIQGNTVRDINLTNFGATYFYGIYVGSGLTNIGTTTGNVVGSTTLATSIINRGTGLTYGIQAAAVSNGSAISNNTISGFVTGSAAALVGDVRGLTLAGGTGAPAIPVQNNTIRDFNITNTGATTFNGLFLSGGVYDVGTVTGNTINNIAYAGNSTAYGIQQNSTSVVNLGTAAFPTPIGNTVTNMTASGANATSVLAGIASTNTGTTRIVGSSINNLQTASSMNIAAGAPSTTIPVHGIFVNTAAGSCIISQNTINTIAANNTTTQTHVAGISITGATSPIVRQNRIYDLRNLSTNAGGPSATGIFVFSPATSIEVSNNMITLGNGQTTNTAFNGIWMNQNSAYNFDGYYNTILIEGTANASSSHNTFAFNRNAATATPNTVRYLRNNIFVNNRNNSGGTARHYAIGNSGATPGPNANWLATASNYNNFRAAAGATTGLWGASDVTFAGWQTSSGGEGNSKNVNPSFINTAIGNLSLTSNAANCELNGTAQNLTAAPVSWPGLSNVDYFNTSRNATTPDIGAHEIATVGAPLAGVYTIGSGQDYTTITAAVAALNCQGVNAPVTFRLTDGTYPSETFPIKINEISGASTTNTITFRPANNVSPTVTGSNATALFILDGSDWIRFAGWDSTGGITRDWTIANTFTLAGQPLGAPAVILQNDAQNNIIRNAVITSRNNTVQANKTGTITVTIGSTAVTGSTTAFTTELSVGSLIVNTLGQVVGTVASITSASALTLAEPPSIGIANAAWWAGVPGTIALLNSSFSGSAGSDNNAITNCAIGDDGNGSVFPSAGIYSMGFDAARSNGSNTITGNDIYNFFTNIGATPRASYGVYLFSNNDSWTVSSNSFYQTGTRTVTAVGSTQHAILVNNATANTANGYTINNNYIGGTASALPSGPISGTWTISNTNNLTPFVNAVYGINIQATGNANVGNEIQASISPPQAQMVPEIRLQHPHLQGLYLALMRLLPI
jgi:hypothetical protein